MRELNTMFGFDCKNSFIRWLFYIPKTSDSCLNTEDHHK
jgi:hypothetical protein